MKGPNTVIFGPIYKKKLVWYLKPIFCTTGFWRICYIPLQSWFVCIQSKEICDYPEIPMNQKEVKKFQNLKSRKLLEAIDRSVHKKIVIKTIQHTITVRLWLISHGQTWSTTHISTIKLTFYSLISILFFHSRYSLTTNGMSNVMWHFYWELQQTRNYLIHLFSC